MDENFEEIANVSVPNVHILESQVGIDAQMNYIKLMVTTQKHPKTDAEIETVQQQLQNAKTTLLNKKRALVKLSKVDKVEVLRYLQHYAKDAHDDLRQFAQLAVFHNQLLIESAFLHEPQIVVSTGMGGKNGCLRYFVGLIPASRKPLSATQKSVIKKEFAYVLGEYDASIDGEIDFEGKFPKFMMLLPFKMHPATVLTKSIELCNELGEFLKDSAIVSNVKPFTDEEIEKIRKRMK
ncbi:hypothetical protein FACS1894156_4330 [Bacteroidia bacterium]|nr:hypothetical protein AGMMS4956_01430 [Bacteroidia bacterium]GHU95161.1 hypothetical protein FACS1894156_4330 [Bacteroidia bacterium]